MLRWILRELIGVAAILVCVGIGMGLAFFATWLFELGSDAFALTGLVFVGVSLWWGLEVAEHLKQEYF